MFIQQTVINCDSEPIGFVEDPSLSGESKTIYYRKLVGRKFGLFEVHRHSRLSSIQASTDGAK